MSDNAKWFNPIGDVQQAGGNGVVTSSLTTAQRLALTPVPGQHVYDTTIGNEFYWDGVDAAWVQIYGGGGITPTDQWLLENIPAVQYTTQTRDVDNVVTVGTALWPDGSSGVYTLVTKNATWLCADAWTLTHVYSGKTLTQALVTRNGAGYETVTPAIAIV